jgi:proline iminopeptidase
VRLIGLDQRGVDRSAPLPAAPDLTIATSSATARTCQALDIGRWVVLGQSFGGMLALRYAVSYPDAVTAVIFENPTWDIALTARAALPRVAGKLAALGHHDQSRAALVVVGQDSTPQELFAAYRTAPGALGDTREEYFVPDPDRPGIHHRRSTPRLSHSRIQHGFQSHCRPAWSHVFARCLV